MRSFDEAWKQNRHVWESTKGLAQAMYLAGQESRQTEVDDLQLKISEDSRILHNVIDIERKKHDELQKRLDAVKQLIQDYHQHSYREADDFVLYLEQALKGGLTPNLNTDENGECRHISTTMFADGKAECFHCDAVVNEQREAIGKQSKGLHPFLRKGMK